jgi:glycine cleavage system H protein
MDVPKELRYTKTHEWIGLEDDQIAVVGITDFAQAQLSELTYIELPDVGDSVSSEEEVAVVESVKAASDVYSPLSGKIVAVNKDLPDHPELINIDPYGDGWLFKVKMHDASELDTLLKASEYEDLTPEVC